MAPDSRKAWRALLVFSLMAGSRRLAEVDQNACTMASVIVSRFADRTYTTRNTYLLKWYQRG
jgi:hypothetical protein